MYVLILDYLVNRYSYNKIYYSSWLFLLKYIVIYILVYVLFFLGLDIKIFFIMVEKFLVLYVFVMYSKWFNLNWWFVYFGEWIWV